MSNAATVIAVVGASGGLGASTLSLAVGRRLAVTGPPSVVVDLALGGGGLDVTAGIEHVAGRRWADLAGVRGAVPAGPLLEVLPGDGGCRVLSAGGPGPAVVPPGAVRDVLDTVGTAGVPVVLDVPAHSPHRANAVTRATTVVVLTGLTTRALADVDAAVEALVGLVEELPQAPDLRIVTRGPAPSAAVLDDIEAHLGVGHLAHLGDDPGVPRDAERGLWPATSRDTVRRCADLVVAAARVPGAVGRAS
ncbi:hypothetical protein [Phycicoccus duodecadis]|uniref:MinD-like ATPase involved in chromosome partitioning or flagellar assembly n=1 Tax=Phycicoccus duodecadis TaxID=173053 RepID=A0A2N3YI42_9MICO|nr:hypothetical protein [Phycicoccus duodecadis]PKW26515.1 MinD-like ATPase involved in chromosome partitioning or flagellar assembly [Phycicoccus duodecadis]